MICLCSCGEVKTYNEELTKKQKEIERELISNADTEIANNKQLKPEYNLEFQLNIPEEYVKVEKGNRIFVYDSDGTSMILSKEPSDANFSNYTQEDFYKIIGNGFENVKQNRFQRTTLNEKPAIIVDFTSTNNGKEYTNKYFYIDYSEYTVKISAKSLNQTGLDEITGIINDVEQGSD